MVEEIILPYKTAKAFKLRKGDLIKIETVKGGQVSDMSFEGFSSVLTRDNNKHLLGMRKQITYLTYGLCLYDNESKPVLELVVDRSHARHDLTLPGCRSDLYDGKKKGCRELIAEALGIPLSRVPPVMSFFMEVEEAGTYPIPTSAEPGDHVVLKALRDVDVGITACPGPKPGIYQSTYPLSIGMRSPNWNPSEIRVTVYRAENKDEYILKIRAEA